RPLSGLLVLVAVIASCTTPEAPVPPRISIAPRTFMVGDTVMMKETVQGFPGGQVVWIGPSGREVVQRMGNGPSFYGSGAGVATIKVQLFDSTGANLIAEDSTLLTVVAPPPSNRPAFIQLDASVSRGCGLSAAGEVFCWGNTEMRSFSATCDRPFHQSYSTLCNSVPGKIPGIPQLKFIDGGTAAVCGLTMQGEAFCWPALPASVAFGVFGFVPTSVRFTMLSVEVGADFNYDGPADVVCGLTATGEIYCWSRGDSQTSPQLVSGAVKYKTVSVGGYSRGGFSNKYRACALDIDGATFCWGTASLGDGNPAPSSEQTTPVAVGGSLRFDSISLGGLDACGLTTAGEVYCWGSDEYHPVLAPTLVPTTVRFKAISAADAMFCGIATDSTVYCWSNYPQLGQPTQVSTTYHFSTISIGDGHICGLTVEGPEVCWGFNSYGELGNGSIGISSSSPTPIAGQRVYP
ncbi:MAG TPA: hypothetical protein VK478_16185, partial [Gemmatimonadaceae bacterium]|nr:hypothetical protein [Gemmatimonadaceae bacterium]